ncbi:MAG: 50S ribosomal protein L15 [Theionarchaea archaeon]|nr:50S ribosomal protein L15 [Theionarchaea archaeon]MBU7001764.1 50S ribosomal protein L15 [Theionarchaea archaeon]MBU7022287.1 50S ribosomal protein L15 [Theionarchaea archaeon]MBU7035521.1 50S ribosomal protein L15 [Theionarchaea archaeon]MBU7041132.1 50S ribosomal protein L15 [Theionarchaea archaeon]
MRRKRKKIRTMRGSRTCGGGNAKKRRGAGNRGGRGLAGGGKNKKTKYDWVRQTLPNHLGRRGFKRPPAVQVTDETISVQELDQNIEYYLQQGLAQKKKDSVSIDVKALGVTKVLGGGRVTRKLDVTASKFSKSAIQKIEEKGGVCNVTG